MSQVQSGVAAAVPPGSRIGPYTVLSELGSGGMGRVYLARSPGGRTVAVKTMLVAGEGATAEADRKRFAREVALARRVRGAFTASVVDADPDAASPWMATEYVPAPSLGELVQGCGPLPAASLPWVAAGMAEALQSIHAENLVHRDVKPSNVLLPEDGPRLIDFGISQAADLTRTKATLGTIPFAAPEQARGEPTTAASDVFSFGATLFHLATGRSPYRGMDEGTVLEQLVRAASGDLCLDGLPTDLDPLIRPCLTVDPAERPSPQDLLQVCGQWLALRPEAHGATDWLPPDWAQAIERARRRRTEAADTARLRVGPEAVTERVPRPDESSATRRPTIAARRRTGPPAARTPLVLALTLALLAAAGVGAYLFLRPDNGDGNGGGTAAGGSGTALHEPAQAMRLALVRQAEAGECTDALPPPTFVSDDHKNCYSVSTEAADRMNVEKLRAVSARYDEQAGAWTIAMSFRDQDARRFTELTDTASRRQTPQNQIAILFGDRLLSAPAVLAPIPGGEMQITGGYTKAEATELARQLGGG
ncbi:serine/threonine-protein kinase [Streptomyces mayonensis]|uniref:serine/threonine-protein kinase n=1 Tax=Streptomyces mayonensis TaxID=2750816 RepID=UPI0027E527DE|nr:protein kinase [Streptomyces sp. A108]